MNVLLIPIGSSGDVHPFVALGRALQERGHRVTMITNGHFEPLARRAGFDFEPLGSAEEYRTVIDLPDIWDPREGFRLVLQWAVLRPLRRIYELIESRNVPGETVVVAPVLAFGARIAQEQLGVPLVTVILQPVLIRSLIRVPKLPLLPLSSRMPAAWNRLLYWLSDVRVIDPLLGREVNAFRAELGLPPVRRFVNGWWFSPQRIVGLFPDWFGLPQPDWPEQVRLTGFPLYDESDSTPIAPEVERFLDAGEPPIVFTPGSAMRQGKAFFEAAIEACRRLGRRGLLISPFRDQLPDRLPSRIAAFDSVPFSRIFPGSAAVVHHGGIGTLAQGLAAGVPQLIMPMAHDQQDNADRLVRLGVARALRPRQFRGPAVAEALDALIHSPEITESCRAVARRLPGPDPLPEVCRLVEEAVVGVHPLASPS